jgi:nonsense-mediated mRNA decay protein 3
VRTFCPRCGKNTDELYDGLCSDCIESSFVLFTYPDVAEVKVCPRCGAFFEKGKWIDDFEKNVHAIVRRILKINPEVGGAHVDISTDFIDKNIAIATVRATARLGNLDVEDRGKIELRMKRNACEKCSKISGGYYEAIVQLRAENRFPADAERKRFEEIARNSVLKGRGAAPNSFVSKVDSMKEGVDIYVGDVKAAEKIAYAVVEQMGGRISSSGKIAGRKDGRDLRRVSYSVRLPEFFCGDIVSHEGNVLLLERFKNRKVYGVNLESGEKFVRDFCEMKKEGNVSDAKKTTVVDASGDELQILDPENYRVVTIKKPKDLRIESGGEVKVVKTRKGIFILPGE